MGLIILLLLGLLLFPLVILLDFKGRYGKGLPYVLLSYLSLVVAFFFFDIVPLWAFPFMVLLALAVYFVANKRVRD